MATILSRPRCVKYKMFYTCRYNEKTSYDNRLVMICACSEYKYICNRQKRDNIKGIMENSYPRRLVPKTTRTQGSPYPCQLVPKSTRTQARVVLGTSCIGYELSGSHIKVYWKLSSRTGDLNNCMRVTGDNFFNHCLSLFNPIDEFYGVIYNFMAVH